MGLLTRFSTSADESHGRIGGIALMLFSIFLFSFGDALGKYLVASYPVGQLLWMRAAAALLLIAPMVWRSRHLLRSIERPRLQLLRVLFSTFEVGAFFLAARYMPLADVITFYLAGPIFVTAGSALFLGEKVGWRRWMAVLVGFGGVLIALQPSGAAVGWPSMIALGGTLCFSALMLITRSLRRTPDIVMVTTQFIGTFTLGGALSLTAWVAPSAGDLGLFAVAGMISVGALFCLNRSLRLAPASVVVPYQYTMIVWAVVLGYIVFNDLPSAPTLLGGSIIILTGLYIFVREQKAGQRESSQFTPPPVQ
jgi:drug/metabolite transporter (DMT)-like permease